MGRLRSIAFNGAWASWTLLLGIAIPFLWAAGTPQAAVRQVARLWARGTLWLLHALAGINHVVEGRQHVPNGPCLIVSNHQSPWETVAALLLFPNVAIVAKQELLKVPILGWYLKHSPMIIIDRDASRQAIRRMTQESRAALDQGRPVLVFPEGTRRLAGEPVKFRRGVEYLYSQLNVPVLPVAVNSGRCWRRGEAAKKPGTISVSIMPPVSPGLASREFTALAERLINAERERIGG